MGEGTQAWHGGHVDLSKFEGGIAMLGFEGRTRDDKLGGARRAAPTQPRPAPHPAPTCPPTRPTLSHVTYARPVPRIALKPFRAA